MLHAFASTLAGHLYQPKLGEAVDAGFNPVFAQRLLKRVQHPTAVIFIVHINEIDDDNPTEIAQPQLAGNRLGRLNIGIKDSIVKITVTDECPGVDINGGHRFRLVNDQITT